MGAAAFVGAWALQRGWGAAGSCCELRAAERRSDCEGTWGLQRQRGCRRRRLVVAVSSCPRIGAARWQHFGGNIRSVSLCRHLVVPPCRRRVVVAASSPSSSSSSRRRLPLSSPPGPHHQCWSSRCRVIRPRLYPVAVAVVGWSSSPLVAARRCGSSSPLVAASSRGLHKCIHIGIHTSIHIGIHKEVSTQATSAGRRVSSVPASILTSPPGRQRLRQRGWGCSDCERLGVQLRLQRLWQQLGLP